MGKYLKINPSEETSDAKGVFVRTMLRSSYDK